MLRRFQTKGGVHDALRLVWSREKEGNSLGDVLKKAWKKTSSVTKTFFFMFQTLKTEHLVKL